MNNRFTVIDLLPTDPERDFEEHSIEGPGTSAHSLGKDCARPGTSQIPWSSRLPIIRSDIPTDIARLSVTTSCFRCRA